MLVIKICKNEIYVYKTNWTKQSYICLKYLFIILGKHMCYSFKTFLKFLNLINTSNKSIC